MRKNCWEFKNCGREEGGRNATELGICPAALTEELNEVHGGTNAGRACWVIAGTLCGGNIQGSFAKKYKDCSICDFYQDVRHRERGGFVHSIVLLDKMKAI